MAQKLTDSLIKKLPIPAKGNVITYDGGEKSVKGFGIRVTAAGARSFILNYRTVGGRERRITIGKFDVAGGGWKAAAAREEAERLKRRIADGDDPLANIEAVRAAPTMADLCQRFVEEHLPRKRPSTARDYKHGIENFILPALRHHKVAAVTFSDCDGLHRRITASGRRGRATPYQANRVIGLLATLFGLAIKLQWRLDNPTKGLSRNKEEKRERFLTPAEIARLGEALTAHADQDACDIVRLLLMTGSRKGEVLSMCWRDINIAAATWTKPVTKQGRPHHIPLSAPAMQLLCRRRAKASAGDGLLFPSRIGGARRTDIKQQWRELCAAAGLVGVRLHDLRHSFASLLVSSGLSLPIIGRLLGHSTPAMTARYSHLALDPLRQAVETVGAIVSGRAPAEVVPLTPPSRLREVQK